MDSDHAPAAPRNDGSSQTDHWAFFNQRLGAPRVICGPMVRGSERAFRNLVRKHGCQLCYSPMLDAEELVRFAQDHQGSLQQLAKLGGENIIGLDISPEEVCVAQLAGNCPETMAKAAKLVQDANAAAVCINLGCPQDRARARKFGAYLLSDQDLVCSIIRAIVAHVNIPCFCKIRLLDDLEDSLALAKRIQAAGCALLAVHARRLQDRFNQPVKVQHAAEIARHLTIPVIYNGGVKTKDQIRDLLENYSFAGVMLASGLLANPRLCNTQHPDHVGSLEQAIAIGMEYLEFASEEPPPSYMYIQLHFRHLLRAFLCSSDSQNDDCNSYERFWGVLNRPWLTRICQFVAFLRLLADAAGVIPCVPSKLALGVAQWPTSFNALRKFHTGQQQSEDVGESFCFSSLLGDHY